MNNQDKIERGKHIIAELSDILRQLTDVEAAELLGTGALNEFLLAILDPKDVTRYNNIGEFLLANKFRASLLARVRHAITHNYAFKAINKDGKEGYASPTDAQWFEDGVMFVESDKPFEGWIGLYRESKLSYAIATRDMMKGEELGPESFHFVDLDEFKKLLDESVLRNAIKLDTPIQKMKTLLEKRDNNEARYQELFEEYPWIFGAQYKVIQRHSKLDDANIPDFSGSRVHDDMRDLIEIKPPFMPIFQSNGEFHSKFNDAWNQAERYLDFIRENKDYLYRQKRLRYDNPKCYLILGYNLTDEQIKRIRIKQRNNRSIELLTYNDLLAIMTSTVSLIRRLKEEDEGA